MRITKRTNIARRVLMCCGANDDRLVTKSEIAKRCVTSESHLAQVVNQLAQLGFLKTLRGRNGGLQLARPMPEIVIGDVFRLLETSVPANACFADVDNNCPLTETCLLRPALRGAVEAFYDRLDQITLENLVQDNTALCDFPQVPACTGPAREKVTG